MATTMYVALVAGLAWLGSPGPGKQGKRDPCREGSPAHTKAKKAVEKLGKNIQKLPPHADPRPRLMELGRLLDGHCFSLASLSRPRLDPDSALALKTWWHDGGAGWVQHFLRLRSRKRDSRVLRTSVTPPTMRKTLSKETNPDHPLAPLLCSLRDGTCGRAAAGWSRRARKAFVLHADNRRQQQGQRYCEHETSAVKKDDQYARWVACTLAQAPRREAFPLTGIVVPTRGWFVLSGRRGHYGYCDEIRAYDLATGAAYIVEGCSDLDLSDGGSVNHPATDRSRIRSRVGHVPLDNLREAVWMTLLANEVEMEVLPEASTERIPAGVKLRLPTTSSSGASIGRSWSRDSGQTTLSWDLVVGGQTLTSGSLTWPNDYNHAAYDHAVELLRIAELALYSPP